MNGNVNMPEEFMFTDEEIRTQLKALGFESVSDEQFQIFKIELERLLQQENIAFDGNCFCNDDRKDVLLQPDHSEPPAIKKQGHVLVEKLQSVYKPWHSCLSASSLDVEQENLSYTSLTPATSTSSGRSSANGMTSMDSYFDTSNSKKESSSECSSKTAARVHKRKVLRKVKQGTSLVCNETISQCSETTSSYGEHRQIIDNRNLKTAISARSYSDRHQSLTSGGQSFRKWRSASDLGNSNNTIYKSKSVILPYSSQTQAHTYFKTDPVALYHYYKKEWANHNIPGERDHRQLRWNIRTMMSLRDDVGPSRAQSRASLLST